MNRNVQEINILNLKNRTRGFNGTPMFIALVIWLCVLPLLALVAVPLLGWQTVAIIAGALLVIDMVACWILCAFKIPKKPENDIKYFVRVNSQKQPKR